MSQKNRSDEEVSLSGNELVKIIGTFRSIVDIAERKYGFPAEVVWGQKHMTQKNTGQEAGRSDQE